MKKEQSWTISQLAKEFDITARSIRFYEEKGLINPSRTEGAHRLFDRKDRTRLKLILRGKRFGLSLDEISEILGSATADMNEVDQVETALRHFKTVLKDLEARKVEIEKLQGELLLYVGGLKTRLAQLEERAEDRPY
ncbi:MAG: MerR family transcriptional regulator [Deltaproteobacteria bacterium]|nr:MAG: MerR family transcriptional regulator [Deltaproteobacteria bacterium]